MQGRFVSRTALVAGALLLSHSAGLAQSMTPLGTFGGSSSTAWDVSADGTAIVGWAYTVGNSEQHAFRYDGVTLLDLGTLGGTISYAFGASEDGTVIVGSSFLAGNTFGRAFRWEGGVMTDIGTLGGGSSWAEGVSADGTVIVGSASLLGDTFAHAFRHESGTMTDLGTLGGTNSVARDVSADGLVVVGASDLVGNIEQHAFRWEGGVMQDLGTLGGNDSRAYAVSANGMVTVGASHRLGSSDDRAFLHDGLTMIDLGTLGGSNSQAQGVSADGSVVVGASQIDPLSTTVHAFRYWGGEMKDIGTLGGTNSFALGVSDDGSVIVGVSDLPGDVAYRAFIYREQMQDLSNLVGSVASVANDAGAALDLSGERARRVVTNGCQPGSYQHLCVGAALDMAAAMEVSDLVGSLSLGLRTSPQIAIGVVLGHMARVGEGPKDANEEWGFGGFIDLGAAGGVTTGPLLRLSAGIVAADIAITRGIDLENVQLGYGSTQQTSASIGARLSYGLPLGQGATLTPFASIAATKSGHLGYTEAADIDFPVTYEALNVQTMAATLGATLAVRLVDTQMFSLEASVESEILRRADTLSGTSTIPSLASFNFGPTIGRNDLRGALTVSHQFETSYMKVTSRLGITTAYYGPGVVQWASVGVTSGF